MKFIGIILRIKSFWTAFVLSLIFVAIFSEAPLFTSSLHCEPRSLRSATQPDRFADIEDYAVFSAVMEQRLSLRETYVVSDAAFDELRHSEDFQPIKDEALNDYFSKTKESRRLENRFELASTLPVVLLSQAERNEFFSKNDADWDKFYEKYPGSSGIINFSNVGYNREKTEAVVRVKYLCALCNGKEAFYFLTKSDKNWRGQWRVKQ